MFYNGKYCDLGTLTSNVTVQANGKIKSMASKSTFATSYRPTKAVTRHGPAGQDSSRSTREPQFLVHVTKEEGKELKQAFDQAAARAGVSESLNPGIDRHA